MQREELTPLYIAGSFASKAKLIEVMWRYDLGGLRHYRRKNGSVYKSVTTFISAVESDPKFLTTWRENMIEQLGTGDKVTEFVEKTAQYGSLGHLALAIVAKEGGVDWEQFNKWSRAELSAQGFTGAALSAATRELRDDTCAFMQFIHDYEAEILLVEVPVWLDEGVGTLIDFVIRKNEKLYTPATAPEKRKRHNVIINYKTSRKGTFKGHILQLEAERRMWNNVYGPVFGEITDVYNLSPKNWTSMPDYHLYYQTPKLEANDRQLVRLFDNYLDRAKIEGILGEPKTKFKVLKGITPIGQSPVNQLFFQEYGQFVEDDKNFETIKDINSEK